MLDGHQTFLETQILQLNLMFFPFELFHLLSLAFPRGLSGLTVPKNSLDPTLLFFIFRLGSLSVHSSVNVPREQFGDVLTVEEDSSSGLAALDPMIFVSSLAFSLVLLPPPL